MSIIGSIIVGGVVGGTIGGAVSNATFNYTKNVYEERIMALDQLIARLNTHLENLLSYRNDVPTFWEDEQARDTILTLDTTIQKVRNNMATAQELSNILKQTVNELDGSQEVLGGFISDALGLLGSLKD